jgi:hypothetical protein
VFASVSTIKRGNHLPSIVNNWIFILLHILLIDFYYVNSITEFPFQALLSWKWICSNQILFRRTVNIGRSQRKHFLWLRNVHVYHQIVPKSLPANFPFCLHTSKFVLRNLIFILLRKCTILQFLICDTQNLTFKTIHKWETTVSAFSYAWKYKVRSFRFVH